MQLGWAKSERLVMEGFVNRLLPPPITISASGPRGSRRGPTSDAGTTSWSIYWMPF